MKQINLTYAAINSCFFEAMRLNKKESTEWSINNDNNALIDSTRTHLNNELIPHHNALNPDDYNKRNRGQGIAEYHRFVTGRSARMHGAEEQRSKAIGCIITLPRDYLDIDYGLTDKEYAAIENHIENSDQNHGANKIAPTSEEYNSAIDKIRNHEWSKDEVAKINTFFEAALKSWQKIATIRNEDMLYAIVHYDESWPHLHIAALPTIVKEDGSITYSTSKYSNRTTHYYDTLHRKMINEMKEYDINASGLLNGKTMAQEFLPADKNYEERDLNANLVAANIAAKLNLKKSRRKEIEVRERTKDLQIEHEAKELMLQVRADDLGRREDHLNEEIKKQAFEIVKTMYQPLLENLEACIPDATYISCKVIEQLFGAHVLEQCKQQIPSLVTDIIGITEVEETVGHNIVSHSINSYDDIEYGDL